VDLNLCSGDCLNCVKAYKKKHSASKGEGWKISCKGIPKDYLSEALQAGLSEETTDAMLTIVDPVRWAAENLDWHCIDPDSEIWKRKNPEEYYSWIADHPGEDISGHSRYHRPYQATMLLCSAKRKVFRIGRQCIEENEFVYTPKGLIRVKDIKENDTILGGQVTDLYSFEDIIYKITFQNGITLKVNKEHPFFVKGKGWIKLKDLELKDQVEFLPSETLLEENGDISPDQAKLLGYILSDGYFADKQSVKFTNNNIYYLSEVERLATQLFPTLNPHRLPKGNGFDTYLITKCGTNLPNPLAIYLKEVGVFHKDTFGQILTAKKESIEAFISTYFNGDGYLWHYKRPERKNGYRSEIGFAIGISEKKAKEFQYLLWKLGIGSIVKKEWMLKSTCPFYRVLVSRKEDQLKLLEFLDPSKYPEKFISHREILNKIGNKRNSKQDKNFSTITSIKKVGTGIVYGWETTSHEIISYCGMRTHNCGKSESICVSILFNMFTKPGKAEDQGFNVILITPYQTQIDLIFKRLNELLEGNPDLHNSIKRAVKAPNYTLTLHNGSEIKGFTAGTKSGNNAGAVRGQHGDMLIFDEADLLCASDIDAALSIVTNQPNATIWMSSTPTGKREKFFHNCFSKAYKEFHYPSQANPMWNSELEATFKEGLTALGYKHEILADFGEQEEGVFQNSYVQAAKGKFGYRSLPWKENWIYTMGVDWNDVKNGTTIAITGYDPVANHFYIVDKAIVSKEGWNQSAACEKIRDMNRFWRPTAIYLDRGFGGYQWEVLKKEGFDALSDPKRGPNHPDSALRNVKQYDFGSKVEIHDLFTKQPIQKAAKPFLVENAVRRFETRSISFPESDTSLEAQLSGYVIDHISINGNPTYKANEETVGDHLLDAVMLSLIAFTLTKTPFGKPTIDMSIAFAGKFGQKIDVDLQDGGTVYKSDKKVNPNEDHKPSLTRTEGLQGNNRIIASSEKQMPGNHLNNDLNSVKLWSYPGWEKDAKRPQARPFSQWAGSKLNHSSKPRRKNI